jgi:predicted DNA-binding transcriptional regulator AlpA
MTKPARDDLAGFSLGRGPNGNRRPRTWTIHNQACHHRVASRPSPMSKHQPTPHGGRAEPRPNKDSGHDRMTRTKIAKVEINRPRAKPTVGAGSRPPSYMSRKELAWELSVSESTVDELVSRGAIPPAVKLTSGCVRWLWPAVETALASLGGAGDDGDPYLAGAINAVT